MLADGPGGAATANVTERLVATGVVSGFVAPASHVVNDALPRNGPGVATVPSITMLLTLIVVLPACVSGIESVTEPAGSTLLAATA